MELQPQVVYCDSCDRVLARGEVENGGYIDHPLCKKKACENASVWILTGG